MTLPLHIFPNISQYLPASDKVSVLLSTSLLDKYVGEIDCDINEALKVNTRSGLRQLNYFLDKCNFTNDQIKVLIYRADDIYPILLIRDKYIIGKIEPANDYYPEVIVPTIQTYNPSINDQFIADSIINLNKINLLTQIPFLMDTTYGDKALNVDGIRLHLPRMKDKFKDSYKIVINNGNLAVAKAFFDNLTVFGIWDVLSDSLIYSIEKGLVGMVNLMVDNFDSYIAVYKRFEVLVEATATRFDTQILNAIINSKLDYITVLPDRSLAHDGDHVQYIDEVLDKRLFGSKYSYLDGTGIGMKQVYSFDDHSGTSNKPSIDEYDPKVKLGKQHLEYDDFTENRRSFTKRLMLSRNIEFFKLMASVGAFTLDTIHQFIDDMVSLIRFDNLEIDIQDEAQWNSVIQMTYNKIIGYTSTYMFNEKLVYMINGCINGAQALNNVHNFMFMSLPLLESLLPLIQNVYDTFIETAHEFVVASFINSSMIRGNTVPEIFVKTENPSKISAILAKFNLPLDNSVRGIYKNVDPQKYKTYFMSRLMGTVTANVFNDMYPSYALDPFSVYLAAKIINPESISNSTLKQIIDNNDIGVAQYLRDEILMYSIDLSYITPEMKSALSIV